MHIGMQPRLVTPQPVDYGVVRGLCAALCGRYSCLRPMCVGRSVLGREIPALMLSTGPADRQVLLAAAFHGQEWLTALFALRLCEELCGAVRAGLPLCGIPLRRALKGRQIWFVPLVNPDGVEIARYGSGAAGAYAASAAETGADTPGLWQANARGVDINHNFNAGAKKRKNFSRSQAIQRPRPGKRAGDPGAYRSVPAVRLSSRGGVAQPGGGDLLGIRRGHAAPEPYDG